MPTTPTSNPIPSESPADLAFNAGKIDEFVNSPEEAFSDRFGLARLTIAGIEAQAEAITLSMGFTPVDSFEAGATISSRNQALHYLADNNYYRWDGSLTSPKIVALGSTPTSSGGVASGAWVNVTDNTLRGQLAASTGSQLVGYKLPNATGSVTRNLENKVSEKASVRDFGAIGDGVADDTGAIQAAFTWAASQSSGAMLDFQAGTYLLSSAITFNGGSAQVFIKGPNSGAVYLSWTSSSTTQGIKGGQTTPISRFGADGVTFVSNAVSSSAAINLVFNKASPKSLILRDVSGYGPAVGGTASNGYWGDGLVVAKDPVYPLFEHCYFFGVGGTETVSKSSLISSGYRIECSGGVFFCNFRNCFANNVNNGIWLVTTSNPGIEGTFIEGCNFNGCNIGVNYEGENSGNAAYYPPQLFINNTQIEYLQRGVYVQHAGKVDLRGCLLYADPQNDVALTHVLLTGVESAIISENTMESRPVHTQCDGVSVNGASVNIQVKDNQIKVPAAKFAVVFGGASSNCRQSGNIVLSGNEYSNTSTNAATNTTETYNINGERSVTLQGGVVMKSGSRTVTLTSGGGFTFNWVVAFPNSVTTCTITNGDSAASAASPSVTTLNASGIVGVFSGASSGTTVRVNYIVIGA